MRRQYLSDLATEDGDWGGNVPLVLIIGDNDERNDNGVDIRCSWKRSRGVAPTITGDHQNRITDYTAIVVENVKDDSDED